MKKILCATLVLALILLAYPAQANAKTTTISKSILVGQSYRIESPVNGKKIKSVKVAKAGKKLATVKLAKSKKYFTITGVETGKKFSITVKTKNKKSFKYRITVAKLPDTSNTTDTSTPTDTTVKPYSNNGDVCKCGGAWRERKVTVDVSPKCWYLGYADRLEDDQPQTWTKYEMTTTAYYPLHVRAVLANYNYDHTDKTWRGYSDPTDVAVAIATIPAVYNNVHLLQGYTNPSTVGLQWKSVRGGGLNSGYAKVSLPKSSQIVPTGYYQCEKCGAIRQ